MSRYIETIKLKDGEFFRLKYHQQRMNHVFMSFYPDLEVINLEEYLKTCEFPMIDVFKCRIVYDSEIREIAFSPYQIRPIQTLKLINTSIETTIYKPENRHAINIAFEQRGECDDVLFVKHGLITDTSYCNMALYDGQQWITPRLPLLYGTQRAYLLEKKRIIEQDIAVENINKFQKIMLFNAMIEFGELEISPSFIQ